MLGVLLAGSVTPSPARALADLPACAFALSRAPQRPAPACDSRVHCKRTRAHAYRAHVYRSPPAVLLPPAAVPQDDIIVQYDSRTMAAVGLVCASLPEGAHVSLVDAAGAPVDGVATDGSAAAALVVRAGGPGGAEVDRVERNAEGGFFRVFQTNKWAVRKAREAAEAAAAAAAGGGQPAPA